MKKEEDFKKIAVRINELRLSYKDSLFTSADIKGILAGILPTDCTAKVELVKTNILVRVKRGLYCFPQNPVHWHCIRNFYANCRERSQIYRKGETSVSNTDLKAMIETLKANGYVVFKRM